MGFQFHGRAGAARVLLPLTFVAAVSAGAVLAQDDPDAPVEEPGESEPGDPGEGEWTDDPIAWSGDGGDVIDPVEGEEVLYDGGEVLPGVEPGTDCEGCEVWTTGGEGPVMETALDVVAARPDRRGKPGGTCSEDGFIPLPWRCNW